jgi:histidinol-phosphate aminotransferase
MTNYWSPIVKKLEPYVPGEQPKTQNIIKLNTNENPYSPSPRVLEALKKEAASTIRLYPDPNCDQLKIAVAECNNLEPSQVFVGNGSDEVLAHTFQGLLKQNRPILFPDITYSFYPVYCRLYNIQYEKIPVSEIFEIRVDDYFRPNGGIIIANPNAPTGILLSLDEIERLLKKNNQSVVVVDEAYIDFGGESSTSLINNYPNLLVIHTLSKSRALAGLRVGFAMGDGNLIEALERIKNSFNSYPLDRLAIAGATAAIEDSEYFEEIRNIVIRTRERLVKELEDIGFDVLPSAANFVFARHPAKDAGELSRELREKSILVRYFPKPRIDQFLRISVGTEDQCKALVEALNDILP